MAELIPALIIYGVFALTTPYNNQHILLLLTDVLEAPNNIFKWRISAQLPNPYFFQTL